MYVVLPRVVLSPVSMETSEHVRVVMMCEFTGSPRPTHIRWERRGMDLPILVRRDVTTSTFDPSGGQLFNVRRLHVMTITRSEVYKV